MSSRLYVLPCTCQKPGCGWRPALRITSLLRAYLAGSPREGVVLTLKCQRLEGPRQRCGGLILVTVGDVLDARPG